VFHVSVNSGNVVMDADFVAKVRVGLDGGASERERENRMS
jgi:hypothetical protein